MPLAGGVHQIFHHDTIDGHVWHIRFLTAFHLLACLDRRTKQRRYKVAKLRPLRQCT